MSLHMPNSYIWPCLLHDVMPQVQDRIKRVLSAPSLGLDARLQISRTAVEDIVSQFIHGERALLLSLLQEVCKPSSALGVSMTQIELIVLAAVGIGRLFNTVGRDLGSRPCLFTLSPRFGFTGALCNPTNGDAITQ